MGKENLNQFIAYWDDVVRRWFNDYIEKEQQLFFDLKNRRKADVLKLSREHMPEPYNGNPNDCSIVIANYNPGGGADKNKHTYRDGATVEKTLINEVKNSSYSEVALSFPIIDTPINEDDWWKDYAGSKWWCDKIDWLNKNIIPAFDNAECIKKKKPFAIEFCGWHSVSWPGGACTKIYNNEALKSVIDKYFIDVLTDAIKQSELKLGICVGAQFYHLFISKGMIPVKKCEPKESSKYHLYLFEYNGVKILSVWGFGYNRYPKIDSGELKKLLR